MKLAQYMADRGIKPEEMATLIGDCSASGVLKWAREERVPRPDQQRRIHFVTNGAVTPNDFILDVKGRAA